MFENRDKYSSPRGGRRRIITESNDDIRTEDITEKIGTVYVMPYNAQHIGTRDEQQDYFAYSDLMDADSLRKYGSVAVLADGMGGMGNGSEASKIGVSVFLEAYCDYMESGMETEDSLMYALEEANDGVNTLGGAGSTLIGLVIKQNMMHWVSVGDSRLYLYRNGILRQLNEEHVYSKVLDEKYRNGEITYEEAINDPERLALTSYLGIPKIEQVDRNRGSFPVFSNDYILICSDGLYKVMSDDETADVLSIGGNDPAADILSAALSKNSPSQDNITVLVLKII